MECFVTLAVFAILLLGALLIRACIQLQDARIDLAYSISRAECQEVKAVKACAEASRQREFADLAERRAFAAHDKLNAIQEILKPAGEP